jgi:hypothetical protein
MNPARPLVRHGRFTGRDMPDLAEMSARNHHLLPSRTPATTS